MRKLVNVDGDANKVRDFQTKAILNSNSGEAQIAEKRKKMIASLEYLAELPNALETIESRLAQLEKTIKGK
jgi:hypothetical protein